MDVIHEPEPAVLPGLDLPEESLDPESWDAFRDLGHRMVDETLEWLRGVRDRPVWQTVPDEVRRALREPLPIEPQGPDRAYADFVERVRPYPMGNVHPRYWGWANGNGTPLAALADMLASAMNTSSAGWDQSATLVEEEVLGWFHELFGLPAGAGGLFVSGCSMGNVIGLAAARTMRSGFDVRREGLASGPRLAVYGSRETHSSVAKAVELLGLGREALRLVPARDDYRVDVELLARRVAEDRAAGLVPIAIVANAGTVSTGAIDDLEALADLAAREELWLHVDGAFGAMAQLCPERRPQLAGIERADSLAFDLHKWMYLPYEVGCVLVRDERALTDTFDLEATYLGPVAGGPSAHPRWFAGQGPQLSRSFRALKVWMSIKAHGLAKFERLVRQNLAQAQYLADRVRASEVLELLAPVSLNVVCFRYVGAGLGAGLGAGRDAASIDELSRAILGRLQASGIALPSHTSLEGSFALRVCIVNHRSRREDFDLLVREVERLGAELSSGSPSHLVPGGPA